MHLAPKFIRQLSPSLTGGAVAALGLLVALFWVFWPTLITMADRWGNDPRYTHGYLVPLFSIYLLWLRRESFDQAMCHSSWLGPSLLFMGLLLRSAGTYFYFEWIAAIALLPCLGGFALVVGGRPALRWSWPAIAFLVFMVPLPFRFEVALALPLQRIATVASTYVLQTFGFIAIAEGNTIRMGDVRLGVVEACSGLSMLLIFFALSTAVAIIIRRPWYEKCLIFLSAIPIALGVNIARITVTGVLHKTVGHEIADRVFHDLAGWLMMPLALALVWLELRLFSWVVKYRSIQLVETPLQTTSTDDIIMVSQAPDRTAQEVPLFLVESNSDLVAVFDPAPSREVPQLLIDFVPYIANPPVQKVGSQLPGPKPENIQGRAKPSNEGR